MIAGIELGGTKSVAVLARGGAIVDRLQVPTTLPGPTLAALGARVAAWHGATPLAAIGIASFGPVALDPADPVFGHILATPKPGWSHADIRGAFARAFAGPIGFDTDVAGDAAHADMAEFRVARPVDDPAAGSAHRKGRSRCTA